MRRLTFLSTLLVILMVVAPIVVPRAEAWSEPVYTKPWSEPDQLEPESEEMAQNSEESVSTVPDGPIITGELHDKETAPSSDVLIDEFLLNFENLYGTWYIWTPGSAIHLYDTKDGKYVTHDYVAGADQGKVVINEDGTYSMSHGAWGDDEVEGKWRLSFPKEINGEVLQAIVLLDGITNVDWAVAPSASGKIRLLWAMGWADGSATWIFDAELYRK